MEAYSDFAYVYDIFMDNTPYEKWGGFVLDRLRRAGIEDGILLDLGCGTGNMTELLADAGYDMIGVDLSEEMLNVAMEKRVFLLAIISSIFINLVMPFLFFGKKGVLRP